MNTKRSLQADDQTASMFSEPRTTPGGNLSFLRVESSRNPGSPCLSIDPSPVVVSERSKVDLSNAATGLSPSPPSHASANTSRKAWRDSLSMRAKLDRQIMACIEADAAQGGNGLIGEVVADRIGRKIQSVSGNMNHLATAGLIVQSGHQGRTSSRYLAQKMTLGPGQLIPKAGSTLAPVLNPELLPNGAA